MIEQQTAKLANTMLILGVRFVFQVKWPKEEPLCMLVSMIILVINNAAYVAW